MAEEDNFDIDIYGEEGNDNTDYKEGDEFDFNTQDESDLTQTDGAADAPAKTPQQSQPNPTSEPTEELISPAAQALHQGTKRSLSTTSEPGSTPALMISELHWWTTEDDIRGWANTASSEDELKEITFSEHKVNGKSKGQAYVEFESAGAATVLKHQIEALSEEKGNNALRASVTYANHLLNPFKTSPKDAPARKEESRRGAYNDGPGQRAGYQNTGFRGRGGGGGFQRGGGGGGGGYNAGGYNNNRNFSGGGAMNGGYQGGGMNGGFQPNPMMNGFNGGFNRGGGMAMRGGRGGMNTGMGMPMNGMMGMNPMMGGMNMGFQGNQMFNPQMQMFGQAQGWGQQGGGPNKRQRQE